MLEENVQFLEQYKKLDNFIKQAWSSDVGVTFYIDRMDETNLSSRYYSFYDELKRLRHIRNKLTHEPNTMAQDMCDENDIYSLADLYNSFMTGSDPFSLYRKSKSSGTGKQTSQNTKTYSYTNYSSQSSSNNNSILVLLIIIGIFLTCLFFMIR